MMQLVNVTESAKNKIVELLKAEGDPNLRVRLFIQGGG